MPPSEARVIKILIVDDQKSNVRLLEQTLLRAGYTGVMSTTEPREVAALHQEHHYSLILLDLQMPEMNGFEVMEQLHEIRKTDPVAILVLSADATQLPAVFESGADSFMGKPFRLPDVVERVQLMLKDAPPPRTPRLRVKPKPAHAEARSTRRPTQSTADSPGLPSASPAVPVSAAPRPEESPMPDSPRSPGSAG
jgi:CheY-like chemotaxis protein